MTGDTDTPKPAAKKKATTTKKTPAKKQADSKQLEVMLLTISNVAAARPGMEMWRLSPEEVRSIAEPLSNMLAKNEAIGNALDEHGDAIALVTAVLMIAFPRVMAMQAMKKQQQEKTTLPSVQKGDQHGNATRTQGHNEGKTRNGSGGTSPIPTDARPVFGGELHQLIPSGGY